MTPAALNDRFNVTAANYAHDLLALTCDYDLVKRLHRVLYRLTETWAAFFDENLDASKLDTDTDD